jgi:hypothetical protein
LDAVIPIRLRISVHPGHNPTIVFRTTDYIEPECGFEEFQMRAHRRGGTSSAAMTGTKRLVAAQCGINELQRAIPR